MSAELATRCSRPRAAGFAPLLEASHDLLTGASATEFGVFTFAGTTCDRPATISDRWRSDQIIAQ